MGPHADKERRLDRLKAYLDVAGLKIDVSCSRNTSRVNDLPVQTGSVDYGDFFLGR